MNANTNHPQRTEDAPDRTRHGVLLVLGMAMLFACGENRNPEVTDPQAAPDLQVVRFGIYTTDQPEKVIAQFGPLLKSIQKRASAHLGRPIEVTPVIAGNYDRGISDLVEGKVDFSRFGPASFVHATIQNPDIGLLAMETKNDEIFFFGIICVREDSDITDVKDLKERSFAFGDRKSTIGRYLSQNYLTNQGVLAKDLASHEYLNRHDLVGSAVAEGRFDAGALKESTFKKMVKRGEPLRELARFKNVTKPWGHRSNLDPELVNALRQALLDEDDPAVLAVVGKSGFTVGSLESYEPIRQVIQYNDAFFAP